MLADAQKQALISNRWKEAGNPEVRTIPGFSRYTITSNGQVYNSRGMPLSPHNSNGYKRISLTNDKGKRVGTDIHRLVASTWIGEIPKGMWVNHENGDKTDNRAENLRIDTPSYNHKHAFNTLKRKAGNEKPEQAEAMRTLHSHGWSQEKIAAAFGCTQPNVSQILQIKKS